MQATVKGKITKITGFGAFVSTDDGKTGMIHISEISSGFVKDIRDYLSVGQPLFRLMKTAGSVFLCAVLRQNMILPPRRPQRFSERRKAARLKI